ncbi:hypothetical protein TL16_g07094 [Triparma laevis f. inornata]|uniref:CCR4-NOT transcription complex subunit 10 n=1 Tax=Triparma laevis f. inornata TaxID=1714386 RepID=A0A9W7AS10_9STRA|nr:hypothetical protein TL16_g07094 [Triparma laevis f. inornata]
MDLNSTPKPSVEAAIELLRSHGDYRGASEMLDAVLSNHDPASSEHTNACFLLLDVAVNTYRGQHIEVIVASSFFDDTSRVLELLERKGNTNEDFLFQLNLYKAKVLFLLEESGAGKRVVKSLNYKMTTDGEFESCPQNMTALYLKANYEHLRANTKRALKLTLDARSTSSSYSSPNSPSTPPPNTSPSPTEEAFDFASEALFYNNMGILHLNIDKPSAALHYLSKSLSILDENSAKLPAAGNGGIPTPVPEIFFNCGLTAFASGNFAEAYQCLSSAATTPTFASRPGLWAKIGEACLRIWEELKEQKVGGDDGVVVSDGKNLGISGNQFGLYFYLGGGGPGSVADVEEVKASPIPRAMHAYEKAVTLGAEAQDIQWLEGIVGLAYCHLEVGNYNNCVGRCKEALSGSVGIAPKREGDGTGFKGAVADMREKAQQYMLESSEMTRIRKGQALAPTPAGKPSLTSDAALANLSNDFLLAENAAGKAMAKGEKGAARNLIYALRKLGKVEEVEEVRNCEMRSDELRTQYLREYFDCARSFGLNA